MRPLILLLALISVAFAADKTAKSCIAKPSPENPQPPPSVVEVTSAASLTDPSLKSEFRIIAGLIESSPTFAPVESVIESYAKSHESTVSALEYYMQHPSAISSPSAFSSMEKGHPKLAKAVTQLVSEEATHSSLAEIQSTFQDVMVKYSTIVTAAQTSFEFSYASLSTAEKLMSKAALTVPSIATDVEILTTMTYISPSLATAFTELESQAADHSTALHHLIEASQWTNTDAWRIDRTLKSIETCYKTLYQAVYSIEKFLKKHDSDAQAFSRVAEVLVTEPEIIQDVSDFVQAVSSSFVSARRALSPAMKVDHHLTTEMTYLDLVGASHASLQCAEGVLEREEKSHRSTVAELEKAMSKPSAITNPKKISSLKHRYQSIVTAYDVVQNVEKQHPSLYYVQAKIGSEEQVITSLLTVANELISETSPSLFGDASDMQRVEYVSPTITSVLRSLSSIFKHSPSLSCAESIIAKYASEAPSALFTLSYVLDSPSTLPESSVAKIAKMTAKYRSLASAIREINSAKYKFSSLSSLQKKLTFALSYEPSLINIYHQLTEYKSIVSGEVCSFVPSQ